MNNAVRELLEGVSPDEAIPPIQSRDESDAAGKAATEILQRHSVPASWEYPGVIMIYIGENVLSLGTANGEWGYDFMDDAGRDLIHEGPGETLPLSATADQVVAWVQRVYSKYANGAQEPAGSEWPGARKMGESGDPHPSGGYQPKTGQRCSCRPGQERDNCPHCEGTGWRIDFAKIRAAHQPSTMVNAIHARMGESVRRLLGEALQERWCFTERELAEPALLKMCRGTDEFIAQVVDPATGESAAEMGIIVLRNGTATNRWEDGTAGVPEELRAEAEEDESPAKPGNYDQRDVSPAQAQNARQALESDDLVADNWREVNVNEDGSFELLNQHRV